MPFDKAVEKISEYLVTYKIANELGTKLEKKGEY